MEKIDWSVIVEKLKLDSTNLVMDLIVIVIALFFARLFLYYLTRFTTRVINRAEKMEDQSKGKSLATSMTLLRSAGRYAIYFLAICIIINQ